MRINEISRLILNKTLKLRNDPKLGDWSDSIVHIEKGPRGIGKDEQYRASFGSGQYDVDWIPTEFLHNSVEIKNDEHLLNETGNISFVSGVRWALDSWQIRTALNHIMEHRLKEDEIEPLRELMITYKIRIIGELLRFIKDNDEGTRQTAIDLHWFVDGLHKVGIHWPELDIMTKSFPRPNTKLSDMILEDRFDNIVDELALYLYDENYYKFFDIMSYNNAYPPEVTKKIIQLCETYKGEIIKGLLVAIKGGDDDDLHYLVPGAIEGLKIIGIHWPEFAIIEKSLEADRHES